jgi:hypothetical protein
MAVNNATWTGGDTGTFTGFSAGLYEPNGTFAALLAGVLPANAATASIDYAKK